MIETGSGAGPSNSFGGLSIMSFRRFVALAGFVVSLLALWAGAASGQSPADGQEEQDTPDVKKVESCSVQLSDTNPFHMNITWTLDDESPGEYDDFRVYRYSAGGHLGIEVAPDERSWTDTVNVLQPIQYFVGTRLETGTPFTADYETLYSTAVACGTIPFETPPVDDCRVYRSKTTATDVEVVWEIDDANAAETSGFRFFIKPYDETGHEGDLWIDIDLPADRFSFDYNAWYGRGVEFAVAPLSAGGLESTAKLCRVMNFVGGEGALIVNEWNAVSNSNAPEFEDPRFGIDPETNEPALGNGGDWIELVVTDDEPLSGWKLGMRDGDGDSATLEFAYSPFWNNLPVGTIITLSEWPINVNGRVYDTDLSLDAEAGDNWVHIVTSANPLFIDSRDFFVNANNWRIQVTNPDGDIKWGPVGEGIGGYDGGNLKKDEVGRLKENPSSDLDASEAKVDDAGGSSFGAPNKFDGTIQDFYELRGLDAQVSVNTPPILIDYDGTEALVTCGVDTIRFDVEATGTTEGYEVRISMGEWESSGEPQTEIVSLEGNDVSHEVDIFVGFYEQHVAPGLLVEVRMEGGPWRTHMDIPEFPIQPSSSADECSQTFEYDRLATMVAIETDGFCNVTANVTHLHDRTYSFSYRAELDGQVVDEALYNNQTEPFAFEGLESGVEHDLIVKRVGGVVYEDKINLVDCRTAADVEPDEE